MTVKDVFNSAMALADRLDSSGTAETADNAEYLNRTLAICNLLQPELYRFTRKWNNHKQAPYLTDLDDDIALDEDMNTPFIYGVTAHLFIKDDPAISSFYWQRYEEFKAQLKQRPYEELREQTEKKPSEPEDIIDEYNILTGGE